MNHKQWAVMSVLALEAGAACAQSSVTLYGVIDTGVERLSNVGGTGASVTRMPGQAGGFLPSRWGLRGSEDLGDGLKALFVLESGFSPDKGTNNTNQGSRLFGRSAWVGLSGPWGQLSFGRQYTMYFWSLLDSDPAGPMIYGLSSLDAGIPGARSDNTIAYKGSFGGFTAGATYSFGRDASGAAAPAPSCSGEVAGDTKACREFSLLAKYDSALWGVALAHDEQRGGAGAVTGFTLSSLRDRRSVMNGYVKMGAAKVGAGLVKRKNEAVTTTTITPKNDLAYLEADYALTPAFSLIGVVACLKYKDSTDGSQSTVYALRGAYALSKRTAVYLVGGRMSNKGSANAGLSSGTIPTAADGGATAPGAGKGQSGFMIGMRHSF